MLRALDFHLAATREVALVESQRTLKTGPDEGAISADAENRLAELAAVVREKPRPHIVLAGGPEGTEEPPLLTGRTAVEGRPAAYVCENFACKLPVTSADDLRKLL
jgi:uncharacterized protein YyaL (SSP411 family)